MHPNIWPSQPYGQMASRCVGSLKSCPCEFCEGIYSWESASGWWATSPQSWVHPSIGWYGVPNLPGTASIPRRQEKVSQVHCIYWHIATSKLRQILIKMYYEFHSNNLINFIEQGLPAQQSWLIEKIQKTEWMAEKDAISSIEDGIFSLDGILRSTQCSDGQARHHRSTHYPSRSSSVNLWKLHISVFSNWYEPV